MLALRVETEILAVMKTQKCIYPHENMGCSQALFLSLGKTNVINFGPYIL